MVGRVVVGPGVQAVGGVSGNFVAGNFVGCPVVCSLAGTSWWGVPAGYFVSGGVVKVIARSV